MFIQFGIITVSNFNDGLSDSIAIDLSSTNRFQHMGFKLWTVNNINK